MTRLTTWSVKKAWTNLTCEPCTQLTFLPNLTPTFLPHFRPFVSSKPFQIEFAQYSEVHNDSKQQHGNFSYSQPWSWDKIVYLQVAVNTFLTKEGNLWPSKEQAFNAIMSKILNLLFSPLLRSSSSDSKKGSQSSVKSSSTNTGSASVSEEKSFCCCCGFRDLFPVLCDGWVVGSEGDFCEATWVMWTWLTGRWYSLGFGAAGCAKKKVKWHYITAGIKT